jgi:hypothetical protein
MNNNAITPLHPEIRKAMIDAMGIFGNPSSTPLLWKPQTEDTLGIIGFGKAINA